MNRTQILRAFNDHFMELVEDIETAFPENNDIKMLKSAIKKARRANPRMIMTLLKTRILDKYRDKIESNDFSFFIDKDYSFDLSGNTNSSMIINKLEDMRGYVRDMDKLEQEKIFDYLKNLIKLSDLYN